MENRKSGSTPANSDPVQTLYERASAWYRRKLRYKIRKTVSQPGWPKSVHDIEDLGEDCLAAARYMVQE